MLEHELISSWLDPMLSYCQLHPVFIKWIWSICAHKYFKLMFFKISSATCRFLAWAIPTIVFMWWISTINVPSTSAEYLWTILSNVCISKFNIGKSFEKKRMQRASLKLKHVQTHCWLTTSCFPTLLWLCALCLKCSHEQRIKHFPNSFEVQFNLEKSAIHRWRFGMD